jgi:hypothetical protein
MRYWDDKLSLHRIRLSLGDNASNHHSRVADRSAMLYLRGSTYGQSPNRAITVRNNFSTVLYLPNHNTTTQINSVVAPYKNQTRTTGTQPRDGASDRLIKSVSLYLVMLLPSQPSLTLSAVSCAYIFEYGLPNYRYCAWGLSQSYKSPHRLVILLLLGSGCTKLIAYLAPKIGYRML